MITEDSSEGEEILKTVWKLKYKWLLEAELWLISLIIIESL